MSVIERSLCTSPGFLVGTCCEISDDCYIFHTHCRLSLLSYIDIPIDIGSFLNTVQSMHLQSRSAETALLYQVLICFKDGLLLTNSGLYPRINATNGESNFQGGDGLQRAHVGKGMVELSSTLSGLAFIIVLTD